MKKVLLFFFLSGTTSCWHYTQAQKKEGIGIAEYKGDFFSGSGDTAYLHLLDQACRMLQPDPVLENLSMLYKPSWNGFAEGPTWKYWWIQNSFGPTYTMLPFMDKAYQTFVYNSQALWFRMIGNGIRKDNNNFVSPVGGLMDCARDSPTDYYCKQGDYKVNIHDWGFGFTTAGILLESELLLIRRDMREIRHYLPLLESAAGFVDSRRDTVKNMFLVGTAANLLAPGYAGSGILQPDGTYEMAYLAEISVNDIAALNRLIELEKMAGNKSMVLLYTRRIEKLKKGLSRFLTKEGYFIRSIDKDGTKHGVYGAPKHGYFETTPNQDAMAFRIVDDAQAEQIYKKIESIPELRMHKLILPNYPSYDDMYDTADLFHFGDWVNGGHWTTCEARMQIGYYRVRAFEDAKQAFKVMLGRAYDFRLDNPLKCFGACEYQPDLPINIVYDSWGAPGGFLRGLFEYEYKSDGLILYPHIPDGISSLSQEFPVFYGRKKIYISTHGTGRITLVNRNNKPLRSFTEKSISLNPDETPGDIYLSIGLGGSPPLASPNAPVKPAPLTIPDNESFWNIDALREKGDSLQTPAGKIKALKQIAAFYRALQKEGLEESYAGKHAELILKGINSIYERRRLKDEKTLALLKPESQLAADQLYIEAVVNQSDGLIRYLEDARFKGSPEERKISNLWKQSNSFAR